jgi:hypothetical protein
MQDKKYVSEIRGIKEAKKLVDSINQKILLRLITQ